MTSVTGIADPRHGGFTMAQAKKVSKRKRRNTALPLVGAAGASLAMTGGAAAIVPATDAPHHDTGPQLILGEEEISDVSLATFYVFDKENGSQLDQDLLTPAAVVIRRGCGGCRGCRGCRACGRACRACARACAGCAGVVIGACAGCGGGCACRRWSPRLGRWVFVC
jgi:hypothetical protein